MQTAFRVIVAEAVQRLHHQRRAAPAARHLPRQASPGSRLLRARLALRRPRGPARHRRHARAARPSLKIPSRPGRR